MQARLALDVAEILGGRFRKIPEKQRPHYSPAQRFRALEIKNTFGWSRDIAARVFLVCPNTVSNWEHAADPLAKAVGSLVKPVPPVRRFADAVRATAQALVRCGLGEDGAALTLVRAGWKITARSVRRISREPQRPLHPVDPTPPRPAHHVIARFVHHTWMMDGSEVPALLGGQIFYMAAVFDAFSRVPLMLRILPHQPRACDMARLLRDAVRRFQPPKYLITDLGGEFSGRVFRKTAARLGIRQRFASALNIYATARLERFWRTLKDTASLRLLRPLTIGDLERRLEPALAYYVHHRPHQGLHGATPAEAFRGVELAAVRAISPPRALAGDDAHPSPFTIEYLDPERRLPVLKRSA